MSTIETSSHPTTPETNPRVRRQAWIQVTLSFVNLVAICGVLIATNWDRREKAQQREQLRQQSQQLEAQLKDLERQVEKLQIARKAKQPAPGTTESAGQVPQSGQPSPAASP